MKLCAPVLIILAIFASASSAQTANRRQLPDRYKIIELDNRYKGYPQSLVRWPAVLPDLQACQNQEYYEPLDTHLTKYAARVRVANVRVQRTDECVWMLTRNSWRWVLRPAGTRVAMDSLGRDLFDSGSPTGRVCMNPRPVSIPIPSSRPSPKPVEKPAEKIEPKQPPSEVNIIIDNSVRIEAPKPEPPKPPQPAPEPPKKSWTRLGLTVGITPKFSSKPVSNLVEEISGREACMEGQGFDAGISIGKPKSSFWRLTFTGMNVEDGSFTKYSCQDCSTQVVAVSEGMKVWGAKVERVFRINISDDWPIHPMVNVHGGAGVVTGQAKRLVIRADNTQSVTESVKAKELLGNGVLPSAGMGVGFIGDIGKHLTYTVTAVGVDYPGVYYGRVNLTYWFK